MSSLKQKWIVGSPTKKEKKEEKGDRGKEREENRAGKGGKERKKEGRKEGKVSLIIYGCPSQYVDKMPTWKQT